MDQEQICIVESNAYTKEESSLEKGRTKVAEKEQMTLYRQQWNPSSTRSAPKQQKERYTVQDWHALVEDLSENMA